MVQMMDKKNLINEEEHNADTQDRTEGERNEVYAVGVQVVEVRVKKSKGFAEHVKMFFVYMYPSILIVSGSCSMNECPAQRMLPIGMIGIGGISLLIQLLYFAEKAVRSNGTKVTSFVQVVNTLNCCQWDDKTKDERPSVMAYIYLLLSLILSGWLAMTAVWVYGVSPQHTNKYAADYCHKKFYLTMFAIVTLFCGTAGIFVIVSICYLWRLINKIND